ncbi:MAG: 2-polyprenyl-3-methyl-5-hydroxy-6-metoxy-1,4-benzoquinol methylase [Lentimonas sp.]|jgi:2-polyprenyl-3-methyl-5-hydroxy-6-metoxy-1,4-benzoquinol methylase
MKESKNGDPIGAAILDYAEYRLPKDIDVFSDICDDDIIPLEVLFRTYEDMPELEQLALQKAKGQVLDIGAGAGAHAKYLYEMGMDVRCIDTSKGAVEYLNEIDFEARQIDFFDLKDEQYDTLLMLMNGIGIAGTLANLENTLAHAKSLMKPEGKLLCDSSDIKYLYEDEDGALWVNLNTDYYGNFRFQMKFKSETGPIFDWLYVDFDNLFNACKNVGLKARKIYDRDDHYLAEITHD